MDTETVIYKEYVCECCKQTFAMEYTGEDETYTLCNDCFQTLMEKIFGGES